MDCEVDCEVNLGVKFEVKLEVKFLVMVLLVAWVVLVGLEGHAPLVMQVSPRPRQGAGGAAPPGV